MFDPWVGKMPWRRKWQSTPVFLPGELHGQRSLVGYSPWGHKRVKHDLVTKQPQQQHCLVIQPTDSQAEFVPGAQIKCFFLYFLTIYFFGCTGSWLWHADSSLHHMESSITAHGLSL